MHFLRRLDGAMGRDCYALRRGARFWSARIYAAGLHPRLCISGNVDTGGVAHPVAHIDERHRYGTLDHDTGQASGCERSRVNINPI